MTFTRAFGTASAVLVVGFPLAAISMAIGFLIVDTVVTRRYKRKPNGPGLYLECDLPGERLTLVENWIEDEQ